MSTPFLSSAATHRSYLGPKSNLAEMFTIRVRASRYDRPLGTASRYDRPLGTASSYD